VATTRFEPRGSRGGGFGLDLVVYRAAPRSVTVDAASGEAHGWGRDRLVRIEKIFGSHHSDVLLGHQGDDRIGGLGGDDIIHGRGAATTCPATTATTASWAVPAPT